MLQNLIVFLIVMAAALYALWRWMPLTWRRSAAQRLTACAQSARLIDAQRASQLSSALAQSPDCGACSQCAGCEGNRRPDARLTPRREPNLRQPVDAPPGESR